MSFSAELSPFDNSIDSLLGRPYVSSKCDLDQSYQVCSTRRWVYVRNVPQGSILSVTLFALKINSIVRGYMP